MYASGVMTIKFMWFVPPGIRLPVYFLCLFEQPAPRMKMGQLNHIQSNKIITK